MLKSWERVSAFCFCFHPFSRLRVQPGPLPVACYLPRWDGLSLDGEEKEAPCTERSPACMLCGIRAKHQIPQQISIKGERWEWKRGRVVWSTNHVGHYTEREQTSGSLGMSQMKVSQNRRDDWHTNETEAHMYYREDRVWVPPQAMAGCDIAVSPRTASW